MAQAANFKAHDRREEPEACAGALCFSAEAVSLEGISGLLGQPTMRGLLSIIKILVRAKEEVEDFYKSFVFKNCHIGRIMLQNLSSMT
jgi:hypothetical protein